MNVYLSLLDKLKNPPLYGLEKDNPPTWSTIVSNLPSNVTEPILVIPLSSNWKKIFLSSPDSINLKYFCQGPF